MSSSQLGLGVMIQMLGGNEVQFLRIHAEDETVVFETHNEHNGYYGGFWIQVKEI
jgi:hypothetical protein